MADIAKFLPEIIRTSTNKGLFSRKGLKNIIHRNDICEKVNASTIPCYACHWKKDTEGWSLNYTELNDKNENDMTDILFASSALPIVFEAVDSKGNQHCDGGVIKKPVNEQTKMNDNCPIKPLYDNTKNPLRNFIVVMLDGKAETVNKVKANAMEQYPDCHFIWITPSDKIYLGHTKIPVIDDGLLDFNSKSAEQRINLGEEEAEMPLLMDRIQGFYQI